MQLKDLFRDLSYGQLSNLAIGGNGTGVINEDGKPRIVSYTNEALLRLHSKFLLRENILFFGQVEHLTYYYMLERYARSGLTDPPCAETPHLYILDNADEPYQGDLIKIMQVLDEFGTQIPLNDAERADSIYTPQPNLIQIPEPIDGKVLSVEYQARHPIIGQDDFCQEIDLPYVLEGALKSYIAYKVYSDMNGQENAAKAVEHMAMYTGICDEVTSMDTVSQSRSTTPVKFFERGFV
jgi:hypothetical protein